MRAFGCTVMVRMPMCLIRFMFEVVSTKGTYGMLVPMNSFGRFYIVVYGIAVVVNTPSYYHISVFLSLHNYPLYYLQHLLPTPPHPFHYLSQNCLQGNLCYLSST